MKKVLFVFLLIALGVGGYFGYKYYINYSTEETVDVLQKVRVDRQTVRQIMDATGIMKSQVGAAIKIGARATGELKEVTVKVGDRVKKGQLLAIIDSRELFAAEEEALAQVALVQARYEYVLKNIDRVRRLVRQKVETQDALDQVQQEFLVAKQEIVAANARLKSVRIQISYTKIYSPIDGVVSLVAAQEGETVVSGLQVSNLVTVVDVSALELWIYVDETDIGAASKGQLVEFKVDAYPTKVFRGNIDQVYPEPEIRDEIVYYRALVRIGPDEAKFLRPEMTVHCSIVVDSIENTLSIPNNAVKWIKGKEQVYIVEGENKVKLVVPELGVVGRSRTQIVSGVKEGEFVATDIRFSKGGKRGTKVNPAKLANKKM